MSGLGTIQNARIIPNGTQWNEGSFPVFGRSLPAVEMTVVIGWSSTQMERSRMKGRSSRMECSRMRGRHPEWNVVE